MFASATQSALHLNEIREYIYGDHESFLTYIYTVGSRRVPDMNQALGCLSAE